MSDERKAFEAWFYSFTKEDGGRMLNHADAWAAWQAAFSNARNAALEEAAKVCKEHAANRNPPHKEYETYEDGWLDASNECEWAIRALVASSTGR